MFEFDRIIYNKYHPNLGQFTKGNHLNPPTTKPYIISTH
jgi:hypothetical protein